MEAGEVALQGLVVPGRDASPGLQLVDQPLDGVPLLVEVGVVTEGAAAPGAFLLPVGGLADVLRDDGLYMASALVCAIAAGRVCLVPGDRVRPGARASHGPRTRIFPSTGMNCGLSAARPAVRTNASGRHFRSAARSTLLVCPPRERPSRAAFSRSFRRRRTHRRSSRSGSASASCPFVLRGYPL